MRGSFTAAETSTAATTRRRTGSERGACFRFSVVGGDGGSGPVGTRWKFLRSPSNSELRNWRMPSQHGRSSPDQWYAPVAVTGAVESLT